MSFDTKYKDKTILECWVRPNLEELQELDSNGCFQISPDRPRIFTAGTIIEKAEELLEH